MLREKVILVDVDGVLLDWEYHFDKWMAESKPELSLVDPDNYKINEKYSVDRAYGKRLAKKFNESADIGFLSPLRDSIKFIRKLNEEHGFVFHAITSQSSRPAAQKLRIRNLEGIFGKVFEKYTILDTGADKDEALAEYRNTGAFWVEDKMQNAELGLDLGLDSILVAHKHNESYNGAAPRFWTWSDIYHYIVGSIAEDSMLEHVKSYMNPVHIALNPTPIEKEK